MKKYLLSKPKGEMVTHNKKKPEDYLKEPYARILIPEAEGGFSAEVLEFPGCYAVGDTADEAFRSLEEAAKSWIAVALSQGQEIPPPSANHGFAGRIALRLPRDLHRLAVRKADRDGISLNQCLVTAVAAWVGADNLFERIACKIQMNFVQANFYNFTEWANPFGAGVAGSTVMVLPNVSTAIWGVSNWNVIQGTVPSTPVGPSTERGAAAWQK